MPQLDFFSISNQFFWGIFCFSLFFYIVNFFVLPSLYSSIFARNYFINTASGDNFDSIYYSFVGFYLFFNLFNDYLNLVVNTFNDLHSLNFTYAFVASEFVNFEVHNSSELISVFQEI